MFTIDEEVPLLRIKGRHLTLDQMVQIAIGAKMIYTGYGDELEAARRVDYLCMVVRGLFSGA